MSRKPCCVGEGLKKGAWTAEEDKKLISYIHDNGEGGWRDIPQKAGLKRCGKSCRLRWANYLKPDIKRGEFSYEEEQIIIMLHASRGNKWSVIARHLPKRTDNEIKNYWNTHLKKRLIDQGIDPVTHKPLPSTPSPDSSKTSDEEHYSHSASMSPNSLLLSSDSQTTVQEVNENPRDIGGSLICKKPSFKKSRSISKLLNKVATKGAASIGKILSSASIEGTLITTSATLPSSLNEFSENIQFQMDQFDQLFSQSSDHQNLDINNSHEYNFSQFLDEFSQNDELEAKKINNGGYNDNQGLLMCDVSSTSVDDEDFNIIENITGWSNYLLENLDFIYEMDQDSNHNK